jgi:hypothetical protein
MEVKNMKMKAIGVTCVSILCVLVVMSTPGYAGQDHQDDKHDQGKPKQDSHQQAGPSREQKSQPQRQEERRPQADHAPQRAPDTSQQRQEHSRQPQGDQQQRADRARQDHKPQGDRNSQPSQDNSRQRQDRDRPQQTRDGDRSQRAPEFQHSHQRDWQQHRASNWQSDHRTWRQRGGYDGYLIPDQRFRGYFGRDHGFRIGVLPFMVVGGYPRFQYDGYWFSSVDPWPEYWADNWYDTDDVYVDYVDNGYYLFNRRYPGPGIAISVSM